ncbi:sulfurtransferase [soil metagenome]
MSNLIDAQTLHSRLGDENVRIVDTRFALTAPDAGREAYEYAHVPGAVYFDLDKDLSSSPAEHGGRHPLPDMAAFASKLSAAGISNSSFVVVYDDQANVFAGRLCWLLRYAGHDRIAVLDGGLSAWTEAGYETTAEVPDYEKGIFTLDLRPEMLADMDHVRRNLDNPNVLLVDARGADRYRGEGETMDPKGGHIPGALSLPYTDNLDGKRYKSAEDLKTKFADLGLDEAEEVVVYCGSGVSASVDLIALEEAGIKNAKLYVGSWSDWSSYPHNPVAVGEEP